MEYLQLSMDEYIQSKNEIKQELGGIVKSFVRIGWQLSRISKTEAYKHDGYATIAEFAKAEYGMNPSGVSRFMNVYERYSVPGDTPELLEQYKDFKFAQLAEMLQLPEEDRQIFHAEDKREDIRELKNFNKENENNPMNLLDWRSAQSTEDKLKATVQEFFREKDGLLNALYSSDAYRNWDVKAMSQIINPGDSMSYRKGTVFLMFHQENITVKIFNGEMKDITWEQFFAYTQEIFGESAGDHVYERYFGIAETREESEGMPPKPTVEQSVRLKPQIEPTKVSVEKVDNIVDNNEVVLPEKEPEQCDSDPQLPGQDNIMNHPEYLPSEEAVEVIPAASPEDVIAPAQTRKDYLDTLTVYGAAEYLAQMMRNIAIVSSDDLLPLAKAGFWEDWLNTKVDGSGRIWEE